MILSRVNLSRLRTSPRRWLCSLALLASVWSGSAVQAQQSPDMVFQSSAGATPSQASASASGFPQSNIIGSPNPEDNGVGGMGMLGRIGYIAGETIEREDSITYFDLSPYMFVEDTYLFGDGRLFLTDAGKMGGSAGLGLRQYFPRTDMVLGASGWYDRDDSRGVPFEQLGLSLELFSQWMDIRSNWYHGIGTRTRSLGTSIVNGSAAFTGHNITYSSREDFATSSDMVDVMLTVPVPGEVSQSVNLEASAGYYRLFTPGLNVDGVDGFKLRVDADFLDRVVHVYSELTQDPVFDTKLVIAADVNYWHNLESRPRFGASQFNRIAQWVRRNRNVVSRNTAVITTGVTAINPNTGNAYYVNHVRNVPSPPPANYPAPAGNGTVETPFQFIDEAQAAIPNADIIFVHADSVFTDRPLVFDNNEMILGEGVDHTIPVQGFSQPLLLPRATTGTNRPVFQDTVGVAASSGAAVKLANSVTFAGFDINNTTGIGIIGSGINGATIRDVRINGTTGVDSHGVYLLNTTGTISLQRVNITDTIGDAFQVDGGDAAIVYDTGVITNSSGYSVLIQNNTGTVNMNGTTTTDTGGRGVKVTNSSNQTTLGKLTLNNSIGNAFEISNTTGGVTVLDELLISNATNDSFVINNYSGSFTAQKTVTINGRNQVGMNLLNINSGGRVNFADTVTIAGVNAGGADDHAINFQSSEGWVTFQSIAITGSNGAGINIGDRLAAPANVNTGRFRSFGTMAISTTTGSAIQVLNDSSEVVFAGGTISDRGSHGIEVLNHSGTTNFGGTTIITNDAAVGDSAVDVQNSSGSILFGAIIASDTTGPDPGAQILNNTGSVTFGGLSVSSTGTTAFEARENSNVTIGGGTLIAETGRAVTMIDNAAFNVVFDEVSSNDSDYGIYVNNDVGLFSRPGVFRVLGDGLNLSSGGVISNQTIAGASFFNVNTVDLELMNFATNAVGIQSEQVSSLALVADQITDSTSYGLDVLNNINVLISQSGFDGNRGENQVRIRASQLLNATATPSTPAYNYTIEDSIFRDSDNDTEVGDGDMIAISTMATGNNSTLNLIVRNNGRTNSGGFVGFESNRDDGDAVISTRWNGDVNASFLNNHIRMSSGSGQLGVRLVSNRVTAVNNVVYSGNVLNDGGGLEDTGILFDFYGRTNLSVIDNYGLDANGNVAVNGFTMDGNSTVNGNERAVDLIFRNTLNVIDISRNQIVFNTTDGTGVYIETINGPSSVNMDGNFIAMFDDNFNNNEIGIRFGSVVGSLTLSSRDNQNNVIPQSAFLNIVPLVIPSGVSTGTFLINGQRQP